jgi:ABC-type glycerol-3-phosphate transport system permease component
MRLTNGIVKHIPLLLLTVMAVFPIWFMLVTAFKSSDEYVVNKFGIPRVFTLENFQKVFDQGNFVQWFANSTILTVGSVLLSMAAAIFAAYAAAKFRFYGKGVYLKTMVALMVMPPVVMLIPQFHLMAGLDLINTHIGVIILYSGLILPLSVYMLTNFFISVPNEIIESAQIDGCGPIQVLYKIVLHLAMPAFITLIIVNAIWVWNEILISVVFLQDDAMKTLMVGLTVFKSRFTLNIPVTMAGLVISTLPIAIAYMVGQKSFIEGLTAGAVKG